MRRRSDRGKTKETKEESPEKSTRNSHRHSRRRRKSSSSDEETKSPKKSTEPVSQPLEVEVQNIELPQEENLAPVTAKVENDEISKKSPESQKDWKEDNTFWESEPSKPAQEPIEEGSSKEKEESSLWKVQSANGAGGEIQKLKICRQRPTESPEIGETSLRKRLSRGAKDSRSTDDSTHEESEKDTKKSKHRTRTSSRNSPLVSPIVVCDRSEDSPTKIKIINVGHINIPDTKAASEQVTDQTKEASQTRDTLDIALPTDDPPPQANNEERVPEVTCENNSPAAIEVVEEAPKTEECVELTKVEESVQDAAKKSSPTASPKKDNVEINASKSSNRDSDSSEDSSKPRKVKKKRRRELQSTVQRRMSTSADPKQESSDSEDEERKKKEVDRQGSTDTQENQPDLVSDKENEADNSIPAKDVSVGDSHDKEEQTSRPLPRKRRWGSSKANRPEKKPILYISTDSLKNLIPDAKPVPADELQLSVEEEEGQLDDDDEEDEVVALVAKEEEKQMERERQKEERQKREEKELEERKEERRKRQERVVKSKPEQPPPSSNTSEKGAAPRKILLLTEDAKKLARSPSPPRHKPTSVLYITHLVRPFTVQQLKNLLLRTGTIAENGFWIDKIKSKCYVQYTTEDAAVETRHALHGVRWPTSNPKTLVVEFASHDDLSMALALSEEPEVPRKAEPLTMVEGWVAEQARIKEKGRRAVVREWDVGKPEHPDEALEYDLKMKEKREQERKARKERHHRSATPETEPPARKNRRKEEDAPAKLLDDLFRKTKTSPCIYWLPLTQEQIAVKEEIRRQHMAEHERRMAEMKKAEMSRRERERRNRK